jgi:hypothetical protein
MLHLTALRVGSCPQPQGGVLPLRDPQARGSGKRDAARDRENGSKGGDGRELLSRMDADEPREVLLGALRRAARPRRRASLPPRLLWTGSSQSL